MSRESEKAMKEMQKYLSANAKGDMSEEDIDKLLKNFTIDYNKNLSGRLTEKNAKTADDFLELAENTSDKVKAEKYIKKAMKLEPDNLDVINAMLDLSEEDDPWEYYRKLSEAVKKGRELIEKNGFMAEENIGYFWGILETRPYMRLLARYVDFLIEAGMMNPASEECEEMIRLSENDNLGMRYRLMHIYAFLENEKPALKLYKKYDGDKETQMLLPLSMLYFKKGNFDKAEYYLKRLNDVNKDTKMFLRAFITDKLERYIAEMSGFGYQPFTIEELIEDMMSNSFLFSSAPIFVDWAYEKLK